jgi:hypothetical protein
VLQGANPVGGKSELGKHLVGLLAELRRPRHHPARRARQDDRLADQADVTFLGVGYVLGNAEIYS